MSLQIKVTNKIIAIHQPNYIPWLGYFYKIYQSDVFVFLDDAQFSTEGMHNYHYIKTPQGPFRLKIPVEQKLGDSIKEVRCRDELNWKEKHLKTIRNFYSKCPFFKEVFNDFEFLLNGNYDDLAELNCSIIQFIAGKLGITTNFTFASSFNLNTFKEQKIIDICARLGATIYYSGTGAKAYQNEKNFLEKGIELRYSHFVPFEYPQLYSGFHANVTVLDYLMNCGYDWGRVLQNQKG